MKAKGLGMIAVHFCFQLNEDMIMRAVVFCFEALLSKIQKAACDTTLWVDRYESNPNSFVDIVRFVGVVTTCCTYKCAWLERGEAAAGSLWRGCFEFLQVPTHGL